MSRKFPARGCSQYVPGVDGTAERMNLGIRTVGAAYIAEELPEDRRKMGAGLIVALTAVAFALGLLLLPLAEETRGKPLPA
jgi:hypothetical protein